MSTEAKLVMIKDIVELAYLAETRTLDIMHRRDIGRLLT